jgi:S1-C subfamily serine protease/predicted esterase
VIGSGLAGAAVRRGTGPTTGVIAAEDGLLVSSAFNFANKPSAIFVTVPGRKERYVAKVVATDQTRLVTLLKIKATGLTVPVAAPKQQIRVGEWAVALGRTWVGTDGPPSVSVGIISALGRVWGKAIQTDAKVSPINYGGPLIDLQGRVLGILVPASPRGQDETAGVEWYDSGIGFAIPFEDILASLPRLKQGKDLRKGLLGITLQGGDLYGAVPVIATVSHDSAAQSAGIKPGDTIIALNDVPVVRQAQILHILGEKYEGDTVSLKVRRAGKELVFKDLKLAGSQAAHVLPFLGILPVRDDPEPGEEVRYVYAKSAAERAGIRPGDRIVAWAINRSSAAAERSLPPGLRFGPPPANVRRGRDELTAFLGTLDAGTELQLEVKRKESKKTEKVKLALGTFPNQVPEQLPGPGSKQKALGGQGGPARTGGKTDKKPDDKKTGKKTPTGLLKRATPAGDHQYWVYLPDNYDANIAHALVVWLHPAGKGSDRQTEEVLAHWQPYCSDKHIIFLCPKAESENGWTASETDFVSQTIRALLDEFTIDRQRIVAHGMGDGGQMAFYLGFHARDLIRGVATSGTVMTIQPKDVVPSQRLSFYMVAGGKDPLLPGILESKKRLTDHKFPVICREIPDMGHQYLDPPTLTELARWVDSLDWQ